MKKLLQIAEVRRTVTKKHSFSVYKMTSQTSTLNRKPSAGDSLTDSALSGLKIETRDRFLHLRQIGGK